MEKKITKTRDFLFTVDPENKKVYLTKNPYYSTDQKINLTDEYMWEVNENKQTVDLVKKNTKRKQGYQYYSFLDIPEEYEQLFDKNQLEKLF